MAGPWTVANPYNAFCPAELSGGLMMYRPVAMEPSVSMSIEPDASVEPNVEEGVADGAPATGSPPALESHAATKVPTPSNTTSGNLPLRKPRMAAATTTPQLTLNDLRSA